MSVFFIYLSLLAVNNEDVFRVVKIVFQYFTASLKISPKRTERLNSEKVHLLTVPLSMTLTSNAGGHGQQNLFFFHSDGPGNTVFIKTVNILFTLLSHAKKI